MLLIKIYVANKFFVVYYVALIRAILIELHAGNHFLLVRASLVDHSSGEFGHT